MTAVREASNPTAVQDAERWSWVPRALRILAVLGIPTLVVSTTGGLTAIGFWVEALFHLIVAFTLGAALFTLVGYIMTIPFLRLSKRFRPARNDNFATYGVASTFVLGGTVYFLTEPTLREWRVDLPTDSANLGAFVILASAGLAGWGLFRIAARIRRSIGANRSPQVLSSGAYSRSRRPWGASPDEPVDEYWSPSAIEAWRSWAWSGRALHGFRVAWKESLLVADCDECVASPGWDHACGIYATSDRDDVELFGQVPVVGRVEMWGDVVEHEFGYRSSHARITDLWVDSPVHARRIRLTYPEVRVWEGMPTPVEEMARGEHR